MFNCTGVCRPVVAPVEPAWGGAVSAAVAVGAAVALPPGPEMMCGNLTDRAVVDARLRRVATDVRGTKDSPIYIIDDFIDPDDYRGVIEENRAKLQKSPLTRYDPNDPGFRTSSTAFFDGKPAERRVQSRVLELLKFPAKSAESGQVQQYQVGQHFRPHVDAFHKGLDDEALKQGQRTWTAVVYLNDVESGGRTRFVNMDEAVEPRAGRAVVWSNLTPDGAIDDATMHEGTDVDAGEKWIATVWTRDECSQPGL